MSWQNEDDAFAPRPPESRQGVSGTAAEAGAIQFPGARPAPLGMYLRARLRRLAATRARPWWRFPPRPEFPVKLLAGSANKVEIPPPPQRPPMGSNGRSAL